MVQCAMCDSPATSEFFVLEEGMLSVCQKHYEILYNMLMDKLKADFREKMKNMLTRIIESLNQKLAKVPLDKTPGQTQYNRGMRNAFKLSVEPVEKELERLIKE